MHRKLGLSHSYPIARHCMPQKQTHQIAITALRNAAPARGGLGPDRIGRLPSLAMASSSASTSSTKASTSTNASHEPGEVFTGRTAVPYSCLDAGANGGQLGLSPSRALPTTRPVVAIDIAPAGSCSLQTDFQGRSSDAAGAPTGAGTTACAAACRPGARARRRQSSAGSGAADRRAATAPHRRVQVSALVHPSPTLTPKFTFTFLFNHLVIGLCSLALLL
jgi:hypothetical protein